MPRAKDEGTTQVDGKEEELGDCHAIPVGEHSKLAERHGDGCLGARLQ